MPRQVSRYRAFLHSFCGVLLLGVATAKLSGAPQVIGPPDAYVGGTSRTPQAGREPLPPDPMSAHNASRLEHLREDERRKRLQSDAARLVEMSNALKTAVDNTAKDELSIDVVRRAAEIEKIAHDLKERMKS